MTVLHLDVKPPQNCPCCGVYHASWRKQALCVCVCEIFEYVISYPWLPFWENLDSINLSSGRLLIHFSLTFSLHFVWLPFMPFWRDGKQMGCSGEGEVWVQWEVDIWALMSLGSFQPGGLGQLTPWHWGELTLLIPPQELPYWCSFLAMHQPSISFHLAPAFPLSLAPDASLASLGPEPSKSQTYFRSGLLAFPGPVAQVGHMQVVKGHFSLKVKWQPWSMCNRCSLKWFPLVNESCGKLVEDFHTLQVNWSGKNWSSCNCI